DGKRLMPWARFWRTWTSASFLRAYVQTAAGAPFLPADPSSRTLLLRAFLLDKAAYELLYELNNRPDWVGIPLRGVLSLIEERRDLPAKVFSKSEVKLSVDPKLTDFDLHLLKEGTHER